MEDRVGGRREESEAVTALEIVRGAIPGASLEEADHVLWARTPYPCGRITAQGLYRAASAWRRAAANGIKLCDWCHNKAEPQSSCLCDGCREVLARAREAA